MERQAAIPITDANVSHVRRHGERKRRDKENKNKKKKKSKGWLRKWPTRKLRKMPRGKRHRMTLPIPPPMTVNGTR
jgi:hypothetical protein